MAREISHMMMQCSLEAGELFGLRREEMVNRLGNPDRLTSRWSWYDWDEYRTLMQFVFSRIGSGPALVPLGQRYLNELYRTRSAHLYAQYTNWERILWVAKTLMAGRMMKGYRIDYTDKGTDRFEVTMSIPEHLTGFPDFFYFLTGVWTGSSPQAKLQHSIHSLEVHPHHAVADITFDKRSIHSRVAFNPVYSRLKSLMELRRCRKESRQSADWLRIETENLDKAFNAVSNAVFFVKDGAVCLSNETARALLESSESMRGAFERSFGSAAGPAPEVWEVEGRVFRVRVRAQGDGGRLISLEDQTGIRDLEEKIVHAAEEIRAEAENLLEQNLGQTLETLLEALAEAREAEPDAEVRESLRSLESLARHCRRQGLALVEGEPPCFATDAELLAAVDELVREFREVFGFRVAVSGNTPPSLQSAKERGILFLMIQEGLRNAWRHSGVSEAALVWTTGGLRITDRGRGFPEILTGTEGLGLGSLRVRAELLGLKAEMLRGAETGWHFFKVGSGEGIE